MHEFQAEVANAGLSPRVYRGAGLLRLRAENRIAAAHVGEHRMRPAFGVLKLDAVLLAGTSTIAIAGSFGQEAAEDAVLGVKHGQMLIGDGLDVLRADAESQRRNLRGVQIVSRSQPSRPRSRNNSALMELDTFRLKSPINGA